VVVRRTVTAGLPTGLAAQLAVTHFRTVSALRSEISVDKVEI